LSNGFSASTSLSLRVSPSIPGDVARPSRFVCLAGEGRVS
jgi:hypothetical protein